MKTEELSVRILSNDVLGVRGLEALLETSNWKIVKHPPSDTVLVDLSLDFEPSWSDGEVVLALVPNKEVAHLAFERGARGILSRHGDPSRIPVALHALEQGLNLFEAEFVKSLSSNIPKWGGVSLSDREKEVLLLMAEGLSNKEIAQALYLSVHTIKFHVQAILKKLDAASRTEAAVRAARMNVI